MLVFPQLTTGAAALYPLERTRRRRSVENALADGSAVKYADPDYFTSEWNLETVGLNGVEWAAIEELFAAVSGRLGTFTLLEPAGNLIAASEEFDAEPWSNSALVDVAAGIDDPEGGTRASRVSSGGPMAGEIAQTLGVPGNFQYALSVWARANTGSAVSLFASAPGGSATETFQISGVWKRVVLPIALGVTTEAVTFGVRIDAGKAVDLFGMQVDAQPGAGNYQKTGNRGGVYSKARFGMDELTVRARGTDVFDSVIRIVSKGS